MFTNRSGLFRNLLVVLWVFTFTGTYPPVVSGAELKVKTIEEVSFTAAATGITPEGKISFTETGSGLTKTLRLGDVDEMVLSGQVKWAFDTGYLLLANGDILPATLLEGTDDTGLKFKTRIFGRKVFTYQFLLGYFPADLVAAAGELETAFATIRAEGGKTDSVTYKPAKMEDKVSGTIETFNKGKLIVSADFGGTVPIEEKSIRRIVFSTAKHKLKKYDRPQVRIRINDGTLLTGTIESIGADSIKIKHFTGASPVVKLDRVVRIDVLGGNLVPINALKIATVKEWTEDWGPHPFAHTIDSNVWHRVMTMDGKTFSRGLGARAESEITYNLGGAYQEFRAVIGHDDIVSVKPGKIQFIVTGDDKTLYKSPVFQKGSKPLQITVNVTGVQEIVLGVRTPKGVSKGTMANWAMARFLKK